MPFEPALDFWVVDGSEQEVMISVAGEDVLNFKDNLTTPPPIDERPLLDPVQTFVEAARRGMLTNSSTPPWQSSAELLGKDVDLQSRKQTWRVLLRNVDRGAYRVLTNMLRARLLDTISVRTGSSASGGSPGYTLINLTGLAYPAPYKPIPYALDSKLPDRRIRDRYLQFIFTSEPDDATTQMVFGALETWTWLMMLGGYPADDVHPKQSAALPEPAFLLDSHTIEQAFPELFLCDDDCYAAVINWAQILHLFMYPLEQLLLR